MDLLSNEFTIVCNDCHVDLISCGLSTAIWTISYHVDYQRSYGLSSITWTYQQSQGLSTITCHKNTIKNSREKRNKINKKQKNNQKWSVFLQDCNHQDITYCDLARDKQHQCHLQRKRERSISKLKNILVIMTMVMLNSITITCDKKRKKTLTSWRIWWSWRRTSCWL